jgi:nicotinate-nucleotide pyrophosphorylase (carboxylating)
MLYGSVPSCLICAMLWRAVPCGAADGDRVQKGVEFGSIHGSARSILVAERICLNFMQRMSGIATATAAMVEAAAGHKAK